MHEAAVANAILEHVERRLADADEAVVASVHVRIGEFSNVDPESLRFAFDSLKSSCAICREATLVVESAPAFAVCSEGGHRYRILPEHAYRCTECGGGISKLVAGDELDITGLELFAFS